MQSRAGGAVASRALTLRPSLFKIEKLIEPEERVVGTSDSVRNPASEGGRGRGGGGCSCGPEPLTCGV